jgi:hypothetical protein
MVEKKFKVRNAHKNIKSLSRLIDTDINTDILFAPYFKLKSNRLSGNFTRDHQMII